MSRRASSCGIFYFFGTVVLAMLLIGSPTSLGAVYDNGGGTGRWDNPANWGGTLPSATENAWINNNTVLIDAATNAVAQDNTVGKADGSVATLNMTGGVLDVKRYWALGEGTSTTSTGTFAMSNGTAYARKDLYVGSGSGTARGTGFLNISGGTLTVTEDVYVADFGGHPGQSQINLTGGVMFMDRSFFVGPVGSALINIAGGELAWLQGGSPKQSQFQAMIDAGKIVAYGGSGTIQMDYNISHDGYVTLKAVPEPAGTLAALGLSAGAFVVRRRAIRA